MTMNWLAGMASAMAETAPAADAAMEASPAATLISYGVMIVMMIAVFYFMLIRPQRKKEKAMLDALKRGDRICTIGGIYGTIMGIKDDTITLAVGAARTEMVFARWAIRGVEEVTVENDGEQLA